ncbi:MAG TPA: type II toxin-antitoxin system Phd/YefM family antitoxin [Pantoea sp.]|uniref:type II toxin-antitoxin system Phd/YefM family antitoxin n=1 Tax=Pantoea TaxID=53335 RepID=UPI000BB539EE|nr:MULTISPECIES: type II toxin-antitoxin system prevent-host-death family antitoxin [Pantoea]PNK62331.1 type II toxin-antitoxin system Phd/YefM family antitoxin [Pantoea sp. FDAARGOS_194]HAK36093.1 type II toxin-antitoxin system Phd/YefM family antitoxin [Pantoea sp.]
MHKLNLYNAKTNFSKLIANVAATGEEYIIARNGQPMAKLVPLTPAEKTPRIGFMKEKGETSVPDNFNELHADKIEELFYGNSEYGAREE